MLRIGLTGGIGSGKSTVARVFELLGIPVYYADDRAKRLMNEDEELKKEIRSLFGEAAYTDGNLNRKWLASVVFNDSEKLSRLNQVVHPATIRDAGNWMKMQTSPYVIKEAALLFESGAQKDLDQVIGVFAPTPLRIQRVMKRDHVTREEVMARMNRQIEEDIKMRLCDHIITNNEQEMVIPQVISLHQQLLARARE
ncbi:MAG: dephospho-CoA kinase [Chitinophagaceae bacterium]|nr:dephospho-CoA kinase [Chitinophagaceae bacterium]